MQISQKGINLIKKYEGCHLSAYLCPAGKWTIGYGHIGTISESGILSVTENTKIAQEQADKLFKSDLKAFEKCINTLVKVKLNQNQFDALVSFTYNEGCANLKKSTLLKLLNQGKYQEASEQLDRWVYCRGKKLNGLIKRRQEERKLFNDN